jgi:hypothetical protein
MKNIHILPTEKPSRLWYNDLNDTSELLLSITEVESVNNQHIYITSDEEIKIGDWFLAFIERKWVLRQCLRLSGRYIITTEHSQINSLDCKKIILTTDQDLIKDGVQAIDDEFLEWFVKNSSCEEVGVIKEMYVPQSNGKISDGRISHEISLDPSENTLPFYKIIIPQEEPKQDLEKEMFELEQELDIPSSMRWHNSKPKQETLEEVGKFAERKYLERLNNYEKCDFKYGVIEGAKWQAERIPSIIEQYLETAFISKEQGYINPKKWFEQFKKK